MISVSPARSAEDFEIAARLARGLADWDTLAVQPYGISAEDVVAIFHPETGADILATKFGAAGAAFLIARWESAPAGCVAFGPFDDDTAEIHKFFVDAQFRGKGIGRALMDVALAEIGKAIAARSFSTPRPTWRVRSPSISLSASDPARGSARHRSM